MKKVREFISRQLVTIEDFASVQQVARRMADNSVSSVVLLNGNGKAIGIVTERDLVRKICIEKTDSRRAIAKEIMSFPLITVDSEAFPSEAIDSMIQNNIRHLLVVDNNDETPLGIITPLDFARYETNGGGSNKENADIIDKIERILEYYR